MNLTPFFFAITLLKCGICLEIVGEVQRANENSSTGSTVTDEANILNLLSSTFNISSDDRNDQNSQFSLQEVNNNDKNICQPGFDCVPYYLCKDDVVIKDGNGIIDIRLGDDEGCTDSMKLCCSISNLTTTPIITPKPEVRSEGCGYRNNNGVGVKITGDLDNESQFGEFPWMVAIFQQSLTESGIRALNYTCGGSLISPLVVLTAAHCVSGLSANSLGVRAGEWDTKSNSEPLPHQDREVVQVIIHEEYNKRNLRNDIALLFLSTPFDTTVGIVSPICLPPPDAVFDYLRCYATGWGKNKFDDKDFTQVILKKIDLPIVPHDECQESLRKTRLSKYFILDNSFICAGGEKDKDTCTGDGGSPLVCPINGVGNQYYQVGIVSWGIACGEEIPGVYVKVSKFRNWIDQIISSKQLNKSVYTPQ